MEGGCNAKRRENEGSPVVVGRDGIRDPSRVRVRVDDADGRDVHLGRLVEEDVVIDRVQTDDEVR